MLPGAVLGRAGQDLAHFPGKLRQSTAVHSTRAVRDQPFPSHHRQPWCFSPAGGKAPQPHGNEWLGPAGAAALCLSFPSTASASSGTAAVPGAHFPPRDTAGTSLPHPMSATTPCPPHRGDPRVLGCFKVICKVRLGGCRAAQARG